MVLINNNAYSVANFKALSIDHDDEYKDGRASIKDGGITNYTTELIEDYQIMANVDRKIAKLAHSFTMTPFQKLHIAINRAAEKGFKPGEAYIGRTKDGRLKAYQKGLSYLWAKYILKVDFTDLTGKGTGFIDLIGKYLAVINEESELFKTEMDSQGLRDDVLCKFAQSAELVLFSTNPSKEGDAHSRKQELLKQARVLKEATKLSEPSIFPDNPLDKI